jgi:xylose isomerase
MPYQVTVRWHDDDHSTRWPDVGKQVKTRDEAEQVIVEHFAEKGPPQTTQTKLDWNSERMAAFARWPMSSRTEDDPEPHAYVYYLITEKPAPRTVSVRGRRKGRR